MEFFNKHYITMDERGRITAGFSDAFRSPVDTDTCINEKGGYQFRLFRGGEENPPLFEEHGIPLYRYEGGVIEHRTVEDIAEDIASLVIPEPAPSTEERVTELEEQLAESDAVALALYETQVEQESVIAEHDEAILGIYEMIGG